MDAVLGLSMALGIFSTLAGSYWCAVGYNYSVAAKHESTTVGRVLGMISGRGGSAFQYVFYVNGVALDDYSDVCATPITPDACHNHGQVLVYYSY